MAFIGAKPTNVPLTSSDLQDSIITSAKIVDGTIATADISDGAVTSVKTTGVGGANTPSFLAYQSSNQNILNSGWTQLTFDTETYDTNNDFASSTFTPTEAGKYLIYGHLYLSSLDNTFRVMHQIRKNNSEIFVNLKSSGGTQDHTLESFVVAEANGTSDYFTIFASQNTGGTNRTTSGPNTRFGAFKIIE